MPIPGQIAGKVSASQITGTTSLQSIGSYKSDLIETTLCKYKESQAN